MSPSTSPLRRRLGHGGLSLLVAATGTTLLWTASAGTASAGPSSGGSTCVAGRCTRTLSTATRQDFLVPAGVTAVRADLTGAAGGGWQGVGSGGSGGLSSATLQVQPGENLTVVVGGHGQTAGSDNGGHNRDGGFGGGGVGGYNLANTVGGASGGGGSFVFGPLNTLLLAAGGGGGASGTSRGGQGGSATTSAGPGGDGGGGAMSGAIGTNATNGTGGRAGSPGGTDGAAASGALTSAGSLPLGGGGGNSPAYPGGGGGGGAYAGGGGGGSASEGQAGGGGGAGGAGLAAAGLTDVTGSKATNSSDAVGDGSAVLHWSPNPVFTSTAPAATFGGTYTVAATSDVTDTPITYSVDPTTTNAACSIDGTLVTVVHAGTCAIAADQAGVAPYPAGHAVQTSQVSKASQTITFAALPEAGKVGDEVELEATGGQSGAPVVLGVDASSSPAACTIDGTTLTLTGKGTCSVTASQAGDDDYAAAAPVTHEVAVSQVATTTTLTLSPENPVYGEQVTATAAVTEASAGTVRFSVDGMAVGDPVALVGGRASVDLDVGLSAKGHRVEAAFVATNDTTYAGSDDAQTLAVAKAATRTTVAVRKDRASVTVRAVEPGAGTPEGHVVFTVGGQESGPVELTYGTATMDTSVPTGTTVSVRYDGDENFADSSDSTLRTDPTIEAKVTSEVKRSDAGWYRTPVTVSFTCTRGSAPIQGDCPEPVVLDQDGASQDVSRTITAEDGGIATAGVTGIDIDMTRPDVDVLGVKEGERFFATAPEAGCVAEDSLSGVRACAADRDVDGKAVTYVARALDHADNVNNVEVHAKTYNYGIDDAPYADGAYTVTAGQTYTLVANTTHHARLLKVTSAKKTPSKKSTRFRSTSTVTGGHTWALGYTIGASLKPGKTYHLGIQGGKRHTITIHVVAGCPGGRSGRC